MSLITIYTLVNRELFTSTILNIGYLIFRFILGYFIRKNKLPYLELRD